MSNINKDFYRSLTIIPIVGVLMLFGSLFPRQGNHLLVIGNPYAPKTAFSIIAEADGRLLQELPYSFLAIAARNEHENFIQHLYEKGAFLVLDAAGFLACFNPELFNI